MQIPSEPGQPQFADAVQRLGLEAPRLHGETFDIRLVSWMREQPAGGELSGKDSLWPPFARNR